MRPFVIAALAAASFAGMARAAPPPDTEAQKDYDALKSEYDRAVKDYEDSMKAAESRDEKKKVYEAKAIKPEVWAPRFKEIADKYPKDPVAGKSLAWLVQNLRAPEQQGKALELMLANHVASPAAAEAAAVLANSGAPNAEDFLRQVMEKNPNNDAKGQATYSLAQLLEGRGDLARRLKEGDGALRERAEKQYGEAFVKTLSDADPAAMAAESEKLLDTVAAKYGDVKSHRGRTLGDRAKAELFEMRNLTIGKVAPDIAGEDMDGKAFKLSEYRGKVILLDFWGYW